MPDSGDDGAEALSFPRALRAAGRRWVAIPLGAAAGVLAGLWRTVRPARLDPDAPWDPEALPFWPFVVVGALIGLLIVVVYAIRTVRSGSRREAVVREVPDSFVVNLARDPRTVAALWYLAGPPSTDSHALYAIIDPRGLVLEVLDWAGAGVRTILFESHRIGDVTIRRNSTTVALGYVVVVTVTRGDGTPVELPLTLSADDHEQASNQLIEDFGVRLRRVTGLAV